MTDRWLVEDTNFPGAPDPQKPCGHTTDGFSEGFQDREEYFLKKTGVQMTRPLSMGDRWPSRPSHAKTASIWQMLRFGIVGGINTIVDIITLNVLLWRFPLHSASLLLIYNSLAVMVASSCSFILNKYWTFRSGRVVSGSEVMRFLMVVISCFLCNDSLIWITGTILHPFIASMFLWANLSKVSAAAGTAGVSYIAMRFWVFTNAPQKERGLQIEAIQQPGRPAISFSSENAFGDVNETHRTWAEGREGGFQTNYSLSVILPAHNEEAAIAHTLYSVIQALTTMVQDFEIIVVDDGSKDRTGLIVGELAAVYPRVCLLTHPINQGAGAALVSGFMQATKDYTFYMDSDGQFDIHDLARLLPLLEKYDGIFGYRFDRQDSWIRKLNAWSWNRLVNLIFHLQVKDIDCAFKVFRTDYFQHVVLEARGAVLLTEVVYKFARLGYSFTQVPVKHLPREAGNATGAKLSVIARAFRELVFYARKWRREEREMLRKQYQQGFERMR
ncbi:MAG TPA: glycosyltransferase [Ktedonobacteraceae bacterium]|nr:glycosyltransferase [Ktedonobacteraceae bacterium]